MKDITIEIALIALGTIFGLAIGLQVSRQLIKRAGIPIATDLPVRVPLS